MSIITHELETHWSAIRPVLTIRNESDYDRAIRQMNTLIDVVGTDESHPLYELLDTLGILVEAYEEEHHHIPESDGIGVLEFLMEEHEFAPSDLPEIGSPEVISEILSGKRTLDVRQIRLLSTRFGVSPAIFF